VTFGAIYVIDCQLNLPIDCCSDTSSSSYLFTDFEMLFFWVTEWRLNLQLPQPSSVYSKIESSETSSKMQS
jgi:hypothetical protein